MKAVVYSKNETRRIEMLRKLGNSKLNLVIIECGSLKRLAYLLKEIEYDVCLLADFEEESTNDLCEFFDEFKIISYVKPLILTKENFNTNFSNVEAVDTFEELINDSCNFVENCLKDDEYSYKINVVGQMCYLNEYLGDYSLPNVVVNIINNQNSTLEIDIPMGYTFKNIAYFTKRILSKDSVKAILGNIEAVKFKFNTVSCYFTISTSVEEMLNHFHKYC